MNTSTEEKNEVIAVFDGLIKQPKGVNYNLDSWYKPDPDDKRKKGQWIAYTHQLKYHSSWDWLMPVVEKIENIKHIGIDVVYLKIEGNQCQIWTYFDVKEFLRLTGDDKNEGNKFKVRYSAKTKIEATYNAVFEFIQWYTSQTKEK